MNSAPDQTDPFDRDGDYDSYYGDTEPDAGIVEDDERGPGCLFPGRCCMPGPHDKRECHTPEMIFAYNRDVRRKL